MILTVCRAEEDFIQPEASSAAYSRLKANESRQISSVSHQNQSADGCSRARLVHIDQHVREGDRAS